MLIRREIKIREKNSKNDYAQHSVQMVISKNTKALLQPYQYELTFSILMPKDLLAIPEGLSLQQSVI